MTGRHVDINGHPTWVSDQGVGSETVLLLHGGVSNSDDLLDTIGGRLAERFRVVAFDRRGHGRTADTDAPFHYDDMATETIAVLDDVVGAPAHVVGWSDGAIISLLLSLRRPDLVRRQVLIGANYHHDGLRPMEMDPDSPVATEMATAYAERSPDGADHFEVVLGKAFTLFASEPTMTIDEVGGVTAPTLVLVGDDDIVEPAHTLALYEALPAGRLAVVPGTSHAVPMEAPEDVARLVGQFLTAEDPPQTLMPSRRARPTRPR